MSVTNPFENEATVDESAPYKGADRAKAFKIVLIFKNLVELKKGCRALVYQHDVVNGWNVFLTSIYQSI